MHGGKCRDFGSGLNCSCPADYRGVGCEYEYDACDAGACKNGATCIDNGAGYTCICPPGFTGKNCEEDIVDCKDNSCPPGATCIDLTERFYCQCPFNLTGDDCRKSKRQFSNGFGNVVLMGLLCHLQQFKWTTTCTLVTPLDQRRLKLYHSTPRVRIA